MSDVTSVRTIMTGNQAVAEAVRLARTEVIAAYPITPQTVIVEKLAEMVDSGLLDAEFIRVESEHSALAAVYGSAIAGKRSFTATSSHGLLYMYEMVWWVANARVPLVMTIVTRTIGPPWNIHTDHTDLLTMRDSGWIIAMAENVQEAFDLTIQGFKISEEVSLPYTAGMDAFQLSHTSEVVDIPPQQLIDEFLPERKQSYVFGDEAFTVGCIGPNEYTAKLRRDTFETLKSAEKVVDKVSKEYREITGRDCGLYEEYRLDDAEYAVVMMGAWSGDAKDAIDILRKDNLPVGLLKLRYVRPMPYRSIQKLLDGKQVLVLDRDCSMGAGGVLGMEIRNCVEAANVIAGIGGVDVGVDDFIRIFRMFSEGKLEVEKNGVYWY